VTAFTASNGLDNFFDVYTGGSVNATLDTYTISNQSRLVVRTDSNACLNHSLAFGSLDTVAFTGTGGTLHFEPTYVRVVAYTAGSGNSPAYGATISQGGVSGVFLGAWTSWQVDSIVPGAAISATGFIKIGGVTGGSFAAGVLTGITATCSGPDVQGWIEVRGDTVATITVPRIGKVTSTEAWFELGTTTGARGQILPCPTTATAAGTFPGVWIETAASSGVYERYYGVGSQVALATTRTDQATMQCIWSTVTGIRIGNDGTNGVGYLPPAGCRVRIPAIILTNSTRTASGTGVRVLPNATIATRQEFVTTGAGYFDLRGIVSQWYMNFSQAFYVKYKSVAINDTMILSEIASPLDVTDYIISPTQAQINTAQQITSCFAGGVVNTGSLWSFSLASAGRYVRSINYATGIVFSNNLVGSLTLRANGTVGCDTSTQVVSCTFNNDIYAGGRGVFIGSQKCLFSNIGYYDHTITTTTSATNGMSVLEFTTGGNGNVVTGCSLPQPNFGPYIALVTVNACYNTVVKEIGTPTVPLALNAAVTGLGVNSVGNSDGIYLKRMYLSNTRTGPYGFVNSDNNAVIENCGGDYADTSVIASLNTTVKNAALTGATTGQVSVYGTHWMTRFTSATAGFAEVLCNEPTLASAPQCFASGGTPQFNSNGSVLLTKLGDQVTWEMNFFAVGYTAFTNSAPTITGTNVTFTSGSTYGNHTLEYQVNTGAGFGGTWKALNAATLIADTFSSTVGFKLKIRATCLTANAGNVITNMRVALTTTATDQQTKLYPLSINTVTFTGLPTGSDVVILTAGTSTILAQVDAHPSSSYGFVYEGTPTVDIGFIKPGFIPFYIRNLALGSTDSSLPVAMSADRNFT
jgi:hypothetical protein